MFNPYILDSLTLKKNSRGRFDYFSTYKNKEEQTANIDGEVNVDEFEVFNGITTMDWGSFGSTNLTSRRSSFAVVGCFVPRDGVLFTMKTTEKKSVNLPIEKVIYNDPCTIVLWEDGTKTIVKAQDGEKFDAEKGFALCLIKKYFGNTGAYFNLFKEFAPKN